MSAPVAQRLAVEGLLAPIDHDRVPHLADLYPEASQLATDPGNAWSVPYAWGTTGLCYRIDLTGVAPTSWNDLLAPAAEVGGRTTMLASARWLMLPGLVVALASSSVVMLGPVARRWSVTSASKVVFDRAASVERRTESRLNGRVRHSRGQRTESKPALLSRSETASAAPRR